MYDHEDDFHYGMDALQVEAMNDGCQRRAEGQCSTDPEIKQALDDGKFVVVCECAQFGSFDQIIGSSKSFVSAHDTRIDADAQIDELGIDDCFEVHHYVLPMEQKPQAEYVPCDDEDEPPF
jgi:hypothetical protein